MDTMEKRIFAFFGQEDRNQTLALLVEYLGLTKDPARQDAYEAIHTLKPEEIFKMKFEILSGKWIQTHDCEHEPKPHEIRHLAAIA